VGRIGSCLYSGFYEFDVAGRGWIHGVLGAPVAVTGRGAT